MTADTLLDATDEDEKPVNDYDQSLPVILRYRKAIARVWGLATCVALWLCVTAAFIHVIHFHFMKYYLLISVILISFFEFLWILQLCICQRPVAGEDLKGLSIIDGWRKTVFYLLLALPCLVLSGLSWFLILPGLLIISLGFAYFLTMFGAVPHALSTEQYLGGLGMNTPATQVVTHGIQTKTTEYYSQTSYALDATDRP